MSKVSKATQAKIARLQAAGKFDEAYQVYIRSHRALRGASKRRKNPLGDTWIVTQAPAPHINPAPPGHAAPSISDAGTPYGGYKMNRRRKHTQGKRAKSKRNPAYKAFIESPHDRNAVKRTLKSAGFKVTRLAGGKAAAKRKPGPYALFVKSHIKGLIAKGMDTGAAMKEIGRMWKAKGAKANPRKGYKKNVPSSGGGGNYVAGAFAASQGANWVAKMNPQGNRKARNSPSGVANYAAYLRVKGPLKLRAGYVPSVDYTEMLEQAHAFRRSGHGAYDPSVDYVATEKHHGGRRGWWSRAKTNPASVKAPRFLVEDGHVLVVLPGKERNGMVPVLSRAEGHSTADPDYLRSLPRANAAQREAGERLLRDAGYRKNPSAPPLGHDGYRVVKFIDGDLRQPKTLSKHTTLAAAQAAHKKRVLKGGKLIPDYQDYGIVG